MGLAYFEARERQLLGSRYEVLYAPPEVQAARGVTVSSLRCSAEDFAAKVDFAVEPSPFCPTGFVVRQPDFKPGRHPYHAAGVFYSQEPSAASAAPLLDVRPGMRVLDLCAAPGGKSSQLASALQGRGLLVANEYVPARAEVLKQNLERMGVPNAVVLNETPERIAGALPAFFDRVLVDAPCSGEGMFRKEPQAAVQHCAALVEQCAALGAKILDAAAAVLAPGGVLVYSTCTFAPQEDEAQVGAFLARHPGFTLLPALGTSPLAFGSEGEANRCGAYPFDTKWVRRIWPCQGGEGHFMAKLQKAGVPRLLPETDVLSAEEQNWLAAECTPSAPARQGAAKRGAWSQGTATKGCTAAAVREVWQAFAAENFPALTGRPVLLRGETVLLALPFPQNNLHILRAGVLAGSVQKGRFVPAHHLFTAYGKLCTRQQNLTLSDPRTADYLRGEETAADAGLAGWCCVNVDGFALGAGKASAGRLKNHYPKALRIF